MTRDKVTVERLDLVLAALPDLWRQDFIELVDDLIRTTSITDQTTARAVRRWVTTKQEGQSDG